MLFQAPEPVAFCDGRPRTLTCCHVCTSWPWEGPQDAPPVPRPALSSRDSPTRPSRSRVSAPQLTRSRSREHRPEPTSPAPPLPCPGGGGRAPPQALKQQAAPEVELCPQRPLPLQGQSPGRGHHGDASRGPCPQWPSLTLPATAGPPSSVLPGPTPPLPPLLCHLDRVSRGARGAGSGCVLGTRRRQQARGLGKALPARPDPGPTPAGPQPSLDLKELGSSTRLPMSVTSRFPFLLTLGSQVK